MVVLTSIHPLLQGEYHIRGLQDRFVLPLILPKDQMTWWQLTASTNYYAKHMMFSAKRSMLKINLDLILKKIDVSDIKEKVLNFNFGLYFSANNNVNYDRWPPIHRKDMLCLHETHPHIKHSSRTETSWFTGQVENCLLWPAPKPMNKQIQ